MPATKTPTAIVCPGRRTFNPAHVTCLSCQMQGVVCLQAQGKKRKVEKQIITTTSGRVLITTQYLYGLNHWHGRPINVYLEQRRAWEKVLSGTWALWGLQDKAKDRRFLMVRRYVPTSRCLIRDRDNLVGGLKPLKDVLVKERVFTDDADCYLEFDVKQEIDKENPRIEIEVWTLETA